MNKRTKNILILLIVLVLAAGAYFLITALTGEDEEDTSLESLFHCDAAAIDKIEFTYEGETVSLSRDGDSWVYTEDETFPLNASRADTMASCISNVDITNTIGKQDDLSKYGLDDPSASITAYLGDDKVSFILGDNNSTTGGAYIMMEGDDNIYLTKSSIVTAFRYSLMDLAASGELPSEMLEAVSVSLEITKEDGTYLLSTPVSDIASYYSGYTWQAATPGGIMLANTDVPTEMESDILGLDLTELAAYGISGGELAEYGLDSGIKVTYNYQYAAEAEEGEEPEILNGSFSFTLAEQDDSFYYLLMDGDTNIYSVSKSSLASLAEVTEDKLLTQDVFVMDIKTVESMTVSYGNETHEIILTPNEEDTLSGFDATLDRKDIGGVYVQSFFEDLLSLEKDSTAKEAVAGVPSLKITFRRNTADEYSEMTLSLIPYDSSFAAVSYAGRTDALINIRDVDALIESFESLFAQAK